MKNPIVVALPHAWKTMSRMGCFLLSMLFLAWPAGAEEGIRIQAGASPALVNAAGETFTAKGVVYYQRHAAHHFFLENLDLSRLAADLETLREIGFNTLFLDVSWGEVVAETDPGRNHQPLRLHSDRLEKLRTLATVTHKAGFYLYLSPSCASVPPQVPAHTYPAVKDASGREYDSFKGYYVFDWLHDPAVNAGLLSYLEILGETMRPFNHVIGYSFSFEMMDLTMPWARREQAVVNAWRRYLRERNPDVAYWKKRWNLPEKNISSMDDLPFPSHTWPLWEKYYAASKEKPVESSPIAWRDVYHWRMVSLMRDGKNGLSFRNLADAVRRGDPDGLVLWKPMDPWRYTWEMDCLKEFKAGEAPEEVQEILDAIYNPPGADILLFGAYPKFLADPARRAKELDFTEQTAIIQAMRGLSKLPIYCQEYGINHHQWTFEQCATYLPNAIRAFKDLSLLGYNLWQSHDYHAKPIEDLIQPNFGLIGLNDTPHPTVSVVREALR